MLKKEWLVLRYCLLWTHWPIDYSTSDVLCIVNDCLKLIPVSLDVCWDLQYFLDVCTVSVIIGQSKGKTVLPSPASVPLETDDTPNHVKEKVHILESAVVTWSQQIKNVLNADPDAALKVPHIMFNPMRYQDIKQAIDIFMFRNDLLQMLGNKTLWNYL